MTAKNYRLIAGIIRRHASVERVPLARAFGAELAATNPAFDQQRFYAACFEDAPLRDRDQNADFAGLRSR